MCHLLLLLPILALPVFWLWPASISVPAYAAVLMFSLSAYGALMRAMRRPVETGREALTRALAVVESDAGKPLVVRVLGERWRAESADQGLRRGETVRVVGVEGLTLHVGRPPSEEKAHGKNLRKA